MTSIGSRRFGALQNAKGCPVWMCLYFVTNTEEKHIQDFWGVLQVMETSWVCNGIIIKNNSNSNVKLSQNLPHLMLFLVGCNGTLGRKPCCSLTEGVEPRAEARATELVRTTTAVGLKHHKMFWFIILESRSINIDCFHCFKFIWDWITPILLEF